MTNEFWRYSSAAIFCTILTALSSLAQQIPTPQQLLDSAHHAADISSLEPYVLTSVITLNANDRKRQKTGHLTVTRDHERARVELEIDGSREIRIFTGSKQYVLPGQSFLFTANLYDFYHLWDPESRLFRRIETDKLDNVHQEKVSGRPAWCVDKKVYRGKESQCFDAVTSLLVRETDPRGRTDFLDFSKAGDVSYPREIQIVRKPMVPIRISQISIQRSKPDEAAFQPPSGALEFGGCTGIKVSKRLSGQEPEFTEAARRAGANGLVILYAIIDRNGKVAFVHALQQDDYGLAAESERVMKHWVFQPASCDGHPVNTEMIMEIEFTIH